MMDFGCEESNRYNSRIQNSQSSLFHLPRFEPPAIETRFLSVSKVKSTTFVSLELPLELGSPTKHYKLKKRPLDLQLSADEFIYHVEKLPENDDLKLSLSIGGDGNKKFSAKKTFLSNHDVIDLKEDTTRNFFRKKTNFSNHNVIDSEEDTTRNFLWENTYSSSHNVIDLEEEEPIHRMTGHTKYGPSLDSAFLEISPKIKDELQDFATTIPILPTKVKKIPLLDISKSSLLQEYNEGCLQHSSSRKGIRDYNDGLFDLNKALNDNSCCSDDHNCDSSGMLKDKTVINLALLDLNRNITEKEIWTPHSENNSPCGSVVTLASPDSTNGLENEKQQVSCQKRAGNALFSCSSQNSSQEGNKSISDHDFISDVSEKSLRADISVREAAQSLFLILSAHSASGKDCGTKLPEKETPQHSFDSFELNTLNLEESNLDDDSVSSKPVEVNCDSKDLGVKLRRGRRMKDFQKEILPSLASLSRHEILEDINIMEGALRSREYRKNKGKMVGCGAPFRSKRSRVSYGGRRNYSTTLG